MIYKRITFGSIRFAVSLEDRFVDRIRANFFYRYFVRPARKILSKIRAALEKPAPNEMYDKNPECKMSKYVGMTIRNPSVNHQHSEAMKKTPAQEAILKRIDGIDWYHSINLGHGIMTPGMFNHQPNLPDYHLPEKLDGMRVIDVATFDGFWAFEFERRGAAEVIALDLESWNDLDLPPSQRAELSPEILNQKTGAGFRIAGEILESNVRRRILNVYDLSPEQIGKFDMVFCSDLLIHLLNPIKALQNIYNVTSGFAFIVEPYDPELNISGPYEEMLYYQGGPELCRWWSFSLRALEKMIRDAGFRKVELVNTFEFTLSAGIGKGWHAVYKAFP
jgi:tRNA (mo5U34)-methyltransferase